MPRIAFNPDPDLLPQLEAYRRDHMPNSGLGDVAVELIRIGLARVPEEGLRDALGSVVVREELSWFHDKMRGFLRDVIEESMKISETRAKASLENTE